MGALFRCFNKGKRSKSDPTTISLLSPRNYPYWTWERWQVVFEIGPFRPRRTRSLAVTRAGFRAVTRYAGGLRVVRSHTASASQRRPFSEQWGSVSAADQIAVAAASACATISGTA